MSWSLQLRNGDLAIDRDQFNTVTDWRKLVQDLRIRILTRLGSDPNHLEFGSTIDGGTRPDGLEIPSIIGEHDEDLVRSYLTTEIRRIITEHQEIQASRRRTDTLSYGRSTLSNDEILNGADINIAFADTVVAVQIKVKTAAGEEKRISLPFNT